MRHFSGGGEFEGIRLLMLDELELIAGGDGEDTDDVPTPPSDDEIVVTGTRIKMISTTMPWLPQLIIDLPQDPDPEDGEIRVFGDPCPAAQSEAQEALNNLKAGSPTAAAIIAAAEQQNIRLNLIRADSSTETVSYNDATKTINWDPFMAHGGTNTNGTAYSISPTMALMHEIIHWSIPGSGDDESMVMRLANEIARELNQNTGSNYDTTRDNHTGTSQYIVEDTDSTAWDLGNSRPGCP